MTAIFVAVLFLYLVEQPEITSMIIAPKLGTNTNAVPKLILPYLHDVVEFQLNSFTEGEWNWRDIVERHNIKTVILHAPFGTHNLEEISVVPMLRKKITQYLMRLRNYAEQQNIYIKLLFHVSFPVESLVALSVIDGLHSIITQFYDSDSISILIENTLVNLDTSIRRLQQDPITYILQRTPDDSVQVCFDLCHYLSSLNVVPDEYTFPTDWLKRIYSVHFSETRHGEGYRHFANTHGRSHTSLYGVARDLCVLKDLGIDTEKVVLVSEVSEANYLTRGEAAKDLAWLHTLANEGIKF